MKSGTDHADSFSSEGMNSIAESKTSGTGWFDSKLQGGGIGSSIGNGDLDLLEMLTPQIFAPPVKTSLRIRVINEGSKRIKDLLVPIANDLTLFDAVYDNKAVKAAHVRKWGPSVVQQVRNNLSEIRCAIWDDVVESPCHTYTIDEMKTTSTRQLHQLVPESDVIKIVLQCVDKVDADLESAIAGRMKPTGTSDSHETPAQQVSAADSANRPDLNPPTTGQTTTKGASNDSSLRGFRSFHGSHDDSKVPGVFRCPFSGIAVDDSLFRDMEAHIEKQRREAVADDSVAEDHPIGRDKSFHPPVPSSISSLVLGTSFPTYCTGDDSDTIRSNEDLTLEESEASTNHFALGESGMSLTDSATLSRASNTIMRIRITNAVSKRYKDIVVDISNYVMLFECVYDNKSVKAAHVRKWGREVVTQVKDGVAEIQCVLLDSACVGRSVSKTFSVDELKRTSTKDLFELSGQSDPVELVLHCAMTTPSAQNIIEKGMPLSSALAKNICWSAAADIDKSIKKIQSEPCIAASRRLGGGRTPSSRINHMNLSGMRNANFGGTASASYTFSGLPARRSSMESAFHTTVTRRRPSVGTKSSQKSTSSLDPGTLRKIAEEAQWIRLSETVHTCQTTNSPLASMRTTKIEGKRNLSALARNFNSDNALLKTDSLTETERGQSGTDDSTARDLSENHSVPRSESQKRQIQSSLDAVMDQSDPLKERANHGHPPSSEDGEGILKVPDQGSAAQNVPQSLSMSLVASKNEAFSVSTKRPDDHNLAASHDREKQIKEFNRRCRSKMSHEHQSQDNLLKMSPPSHVTPAPPFGSPNATFSIQSGDTSQRSSMLFPASTNLEESTQDVNIVRDGSTEAPTKYSDLEENEVISGFKTHAKKINRFLQFSLTNESREGNERDGLGEETNDGTSQRMSSTVPSALWLADDGLDSASHKQGWLGTNAPPLAEIDVFSSDPSLPLPSANPPQISLSGDVVKEIFPFHLIVDENFRILQVGNSLSLLIDDENLLGQAISDVFTVTGPIPVLGKWEWSVLDKMKDKTVFLEGVQMNPSTQKRAKVKGTIIEVSRAPSRRRVMFALFPNVKNLSELDSMNLSMADLPLHSCQRDAVLLGEHSKSEVKLTNHLDQLHRDLINSMEKQIEDRTNELATANLDLEQANARLAIQSARQLEHFACMSHEIRTPLNCIVGMSSLLLKDSEGPDMDPMHADSIRMINTSGELLRAVVDDVLDYAKLESGSFAVDIKETKLQDALDSVVHSISQRVDDKNIRLRTNYSANLPEFLETDSRRLQQVLFNLLGNAGKFSKIGGVIDLKVSLVGGDAAAKGNEDAPRHRDLIRFSVKDYGKGIDTKDFETIFEPFSQASKETQNVYGGTGLGLSITSKLVHRLGGTISVDSELGRYAEFTVDLPMNGKRVDAQSIRKRFANTAIVVVEPNMKRDYSFTEHLVTDEPEVFGPDVAKVFDLNVIRCNSLEEAFNKISTETDAIKEQHFAILVHETLYHPRSFQKLAQLLNHSNFTLMTHGPNYAVERTKGSHFKSLTGIFPANLLDSIATHVETLKGKKYDPSQSDVTINPKHVGDQSGRHLFTALSDEGGTGGGLFASLERPVSADSTPPATRHFSSTRSLFAAIDCSTQEDAPSVQSTTGGTGGSLFGQIDTSIGNNSKATTSNPTHVPSSLQRPGPAMPTQSSTDLKTVKSSTSSARKSLVMKRNLKVLYAEDNIVNQKVLSRVLNRAGITDITVVDNGQKAVDIARTTDFDCIFMDVQMPVLGGLEACEQIVGRDPTAKVIFVTAHALDEFKAKAKSVGGTSFISKPFRASDIDDVLLHIVEKQK